MSRRPDQCHNERDRYDVNTYLDRKDKSKITVGPIDPSGIEWRMCGLCHKATRRFTSTDHTVTCTDCMEAK